MIVLGFTTGHDASVALVRDGFPMASLSKERLTRCKGDDGDVAACIDLLLDRTGISFDEIDLVATSRPLLGFSATGDFEPLEHYGPGQEFSAHVWRYRGRGVRCLSVEHHVAHAAIAAAFSPDPACVIFSVDGGGDFTDALVAVVEADSIRVMERPDLHLGIVWNAVSTTLGLEWFHGPGKVTGLAAYGAPLGVDELLRYLGGLTDRLRLGSTDEVWHDAKVRMKRKGYQRDQIFRDTESTYYGLPYLRGRVPKGDFDHPESRNLAASVQELTEAALLRWAEDLHARFGGNTLCLTGGVALNPAATSFVARHGPFRRVFVPPAPNDAGLALGAALYAARREGGGRPRAATPYPTPGASWGPSYRAEEIHARIAEAGLTARRPNDLSREIAEVVAAGRLAAWFEGGSELGPRALGNRSLLGDPRDGGLRERLNRDVKKREWFRPYAASVLEEEVDAWFDLPAPSPYMGFTGSARPGRAERIPAVVHVDGTSRLQTLSAGQGAPPRFRSLVEAFRDRTGVPLVLNTSLNAPGDPIAESPADAIRALCTGVGDLLVFADAGVVVEP